MFNGKRFSFGKFTRLHELIAERETVVLYPSSDAVSLSEIFPNKASNSLNVLVLDGTWSQARVLYNSNPFLRSLRCFKLDTAKPSMYVIRTQPAEICLSTVEAAALSLTHLESNPIIFERLTRPLKTICDHQLHNGAVEHQSKEFLISRGLYRKPLNKKIRRKLETKHFDKNATPLSDSNGLLKLLDR